MQTSPPVGEVKVWDPVVRIFHWTLALCVLLNLFVLEEGDAGHRYAGYAACALIAVRAVWGFVGSRYARFSSFWPNRARLSGELAALVEGEVPAHIGHSPLGALMMLALVLCVNALGLTGYLLETDYFFGSDFMEEIHEIIADGMMFLIGLHVAAAILVGKLERVNLVQAMVTGVKKFRP